MDKDLLKFENRSDDWLAKQKKEESYVSAWDFDEGKKIKEYHQDNCEATQIKQQHEYHHQMYNKKVQEIRSGTNKINKTTKNYLIVAAISFMFIPLLLMVMINIAAGSSPAIGFIPIILIVVFIALFSGRRRK